MLIAQIVVALWIFTKLPIIDEVMTLLWGVILTPNPEKKPHHEPITTSEQDKWDRFCVELNKNNQ